ncbi:hypothetical protein GCM10009596_30940 [Arthrobacter rhombi]
MNPRAAAPSRGPQPATFSGMDIPPRVMAASTGICPAARWGATARQAIRNITANAHHPTTDNPNTWPMSLWGSRRSHGQAAAPAATATSNPIAAAAGQANSSAIPAARKTTEVPASRSAETAPTLLLIVSRRRSWPTGPCSTARTASPANPPGSTAFRNAACQQRPMAARRPSSMPCPRATSLHRWAWTTTPAVPMASAPMEAGQDSTPAAATKGPLPHSRAAHTSSAAATATCSRDSAILRRFMP